MVGEERGGYFVWSVNASVVQLDLRRSDEMSIVGSLAMNDRAMLVFADDDDDDDGKTILFYGRRREERANVLTDYKTMSNISGSVATYANMVTKLMHHTLRSFA